MTNHKENGYALLRTTFGVVFLFFGIGKFVTGIGNFAAGLNQNFSGKLPSALVLPFAYVLPFAEVVLGLLILLGLMTTLALEASGLLLLALTFGAVMLGDPATVAHNVHYAFVNFILLWLADLNRCSIDRLIRRRAATEPSNVLVTFLCAVLILGTAVPALGLPERHADNNAPVTLRFRLDPTQSKIVARAFAGGPLWFKGYDHLVAARDFSGQAEITPETVTPASLELHFKADSLHETRDLFTEQQKQIINKELREIVLESAKYPEIVFRSTDVTGKLAGSSQYDLKIGGNLTLHGVTRRIVIPAVVSLTGNDLRSRGEFSIDRGDFGVKATSAFHGLVRVRDRIKFTFDIVGHRV